MSEENGWLIELGDSPVSRPQYFWGLSETAKGYAHWTDDHLAAVRFCRKEDAQRVADTIKVPTRVCEHGWGP